MKYCNISTTSTTNIANNAKKNALHNRLTQSRKVLLLLLLIVCSHLAHAQFNFVGATKQMYDEDRYRLTRRISFHKGALWCERQLDLKKAFDIHFDIFLGCSETKGHGIAFVLQQQGLTALGKAGGGGIGYKGISPSVVVEFDNYRNDFESYIPSIGTHVAIVKNGDPQHDMGDLSEPEPVGDRELNWASCLLYDTRIMWDPETLELMVFIDGMSVATYQGDIVSEFFNGNSKVYWGFTAANGKRQIAAQGIDFKIEPIEVVVETNAPQCSGLASGSATVVATGGIKSYNYRWSTTYEDTENPTLNNLSPGNYTVTVTDGMGDRLVKNFTIDSQTPLNLEVIKNSDADFDWTVNAQGGTPPYTYQKGMAFLPTGDQKPLPNPNIPAPTGTIYVNEGDDFDRRKIIQNSPTKVTAEIGFVRVTDANGCTFKKFITLLTEFHEKTPPPPPEPVLIPEPVPVPIPIPTPIPVPDPAPNLDSLAQSPLLPGIAPDALEEIELRYNNRNIPAKLGDRRVRSSKRFTLTNTEIEIQVWDEETVDGDTISLFFNGEWLIKEYGLQKKKKSIKVQVDPNGDNYLILYAHNEGSKPPNTAALIIYDGKKRRKVGLSSSLKDCGAINFQVKERK